MTNSWYDTYAAAILETDWTKMQEVLRTAELEIFERLRILSLDQGGTPKEVQALDEGLRGIAQLRIDVRNWQSSQRMRAGPGVTAASTGFLPKPF